INDVSAWLEWLAAKITGRWRSRTNSRPSTFGWTIASVNGSSSARWMSQRIERTGSARAHPRSVAGAGTTGPCSGHVCGRGVSQCHSRRTRPMSRTTPPAVSARRVRGASEYQAKSANPRVDFGRRGGAGGERKVVGDHRHLELLVLPERDV